MQKKRRTYEKTSAENLIDVVKEEKENPSKVKALLESKANPNTKEKGTPVLQLAAHAGHLNILKLLLTHKADIDAQCSLGETALHAAIGVKKVHTNIIKELLENKADTSIQPGGQDWESDGPPLHKAAAMASPEAVRLLLEFKASATLKNDDKKTPLDVAKESKSFNSVPEKNKDYEEVIKILGEKTPSLSRP